jgi:cell cycle checkpoint protein
MLVLGKGDPSSQSATAKDLIRERELDGRLKEPPKLPTFHRDHERRASRVDIDVC